MKNKNKKAKLISVSLLALCFSMLAFGVYALKQATLTVQGTVGFKAHDCMVTVSATIAGDGVTVNNSVATPDPDGAPSETRPFITEQTLGTNSNNQNIKLNSITNPAIPTIYFSDLTENGAPHEILITFNITNDSFYPITASINNTMLTNTAVTHTIANASANLGASGSENDTATLTVAYNLGTTEVSEGVYDYVDFANFAYEIGLNFAKYNAPTQQEIVDEPTNVILLGDALSFSAPENATSYEVAYFNGDNLISSYEVNSSSVTLTNKPATAGTYTVKVRAKVVDNEETTYSDYVNAGVISVTVEENLTANGSFGFMTATVSDGSGYRDMNAVFITNENVEANIVFPTEDDQGNPVEAVVVNNGYGSYIWDEVETIVVPNGIKSISIQGGLRFPNLTSVTLPNSLKTIGEDCFKNTSKLMTAVIPEGVETIAFNTFSNSGIRSVTLPSTLKTIASQAFQRCKDLTTVIMPSVETIGYNAFGDCSSLNKIDFPDNLKTIEDYSFGNCPISTFTFPAGIESIGEYALPYSTKQVNFKGSSQPVKFTNTPGRVVNVNLNYEGTIADAPTNIILSNNKTPNVSVTFDNEVGRKYSLLYSAIEDPAYVKEYSTYSQIYDTNSFAIPKFNESYNMYKVYIASFEEDENHNKINWSNYEFVGDVDFIGMKQLDSPTNVVFNVDTKTLTWNAVSNVIGYQVGYKEITSDAVWWAEYNLSNELTSYTFSDEYVNGLSSGTYQVAIMAKGNAKENGAYFSSGNTLSSETVEISQMMDPNNVKIVQNGAQVIITYTSSFYNLETMRVHVEIFDRSSFKTIKLDNVKSGDDISSLFPNTGRYDISVRTQGNGKNCANSNVVSVNGFSYTKD